jgi:GTP-binding protein HflX
VRLRIPWARGDVLAAVHREGEVVDQEVDDEAAILRVILDAAGRARFQEFVAS